MPNPIVRARWLAPALLILAACSQAPAQQRLEARQAALDPPRLWRVETLDASPGESLLVCADSTLRGGFRRANAEINGEPCISLIGSVDRPGLYAERCQIDGRRYGLTVNSEGDFDRDFTASFSLAALDGSGVTARQTRRYRDVGPCPAGWGIGDQSRTGGQTSNALTGVWPTTSQKPAT